jgi:hypothetical protein
LGRAVDPDTLNPYPDPDPIRIEGFDDQKLKKKNHWTIILLIFFRSKIAFYLCPSYMSSLQPSKDNIQHYKKWNF